MGNGKIFGKSCLIRLETILSDVKKSGLLLRYANEILASTSEFRTKVDMMRIF